MIPRRTVTQLAQSDIDLARKQIEQLAERVCRSLEPPIAQIQTILQKYLSITALPVIRPSPTVQDRSIVDLGLHTFQVIAGCGPHLQKGPGPLLDACLLNAWPGMWRWLQFLSDHCCQSIKYGRVMHLQALSTIISTVETLTLSKAICRAMVATTGVIEMMTRYWMDGGRSLITASRPQVVRFCARALNQLIGARERPSLAHIVAAAPGGADAVTKHALGQLNATQAQNQPDFVVVIENLSFIEKLNRPTTPQLQLSLVEQGFIPAMVETFLWLAKQPTTTPEDEDMACQCLRLCVLMSLRDYTMHDRSWIFQALDSGIIPAILQSAPRLARINEYESSLCSDFLSDYLCQYLVCRSFVRSAARTLKESERLDLGNLASPIGDAWMVFKKLAQERIALKAMGDEFVAESQLYSKGCSRIHCRAATDDLRRCAGCRSVFNCNRACQKIDWMAHRLPCHTVQRQCPDGIPSSHTVGDFRFIRKIISTDIRKNAQLLKMLLEDELSRSSPLEVAIQLNYSKIPVEMTVFSVRDINVGESGWRKLIEASVSQTNGHGMMVVIAHVHSGAAIWIELCPVLIPVDSSFESDEPGALPTTAASTK